MATNIQIQVRLNSTRLPGKVMYDLCGRRIIEWVVDRTCDANNPDRIVLAIGDRPENEAITKWCERNNVSFHCGPEDNLLIRHLETAKEFQGDPIVRVTGDCPLISPREIDRIIQEHSRNEACYTTNATAEMPVGTAVDVIDRDILERLHKLGERHPVRRLRKNPNSWNVVFTSNDQWTEFSDIHIAVDTPKDYWMLADAIEAVGGDLLAVTEWISER